MESGGKAVTKRYRKKITVVLSLVLPVILLFAILNCFTTYVFYEDYKYKMNLMTEIAAKEEFSGLDAVSELLKDKFNLARAVERLETGDGCHQLHTVVRSSFVAAGNLFRVQFSCRIYIVNDGSKSARTIWIAAGGAVCVYSYFQVRNLLYVYY